MKFLIRLLVAAGLMLLLACQPEQAPAAGDTQHILRRGNGPEAETLDPHKARSDSAANILRDLYEGLVGEAPDGTLIPGAAERWDISADGLTYTFHLRGNARWSNGDPLVAADFVAGLRRTVTPATASHYATALFPIVNARAVQQGELPPAALGVTAPDEHTVQIRLIAPTPYFLGVLTHQSAYPIHRASLEKYGDQFARPGKLVSNGAYFLAEWIPNDHLTLQRNPYYWDAANTEIETVRYYPLDDPGAELARYRAGELDITYTIPATDFAWLREQFGAELHIAPYLSTYYYAFNLTRPPFQDAPALRRALSLVINREIIADQIAATGQLPALGFVPPGVANYQTQTFDYAAWPWEQRLAEARRLYAKAGYSRENPLRVEIRYNSGDIHARIAQAVAAMWHDALGVNSTLVGEEFKVFLQNRSQQQITQVYRSGWVGDYNDAVTFLDTLRGGSAINDTGYDSDKYNALLREAAMTADPAARRELLQQAERTMLADHPILPLYFYVSRHLVAPRVGGWTNHILDRHYSKDLALLTE